MLECVALEEVLIILGVEECMQVDSCFLSNCLSGNLSQSEKTKEACVVLFDALGPKLLCERVATFIETIDDELEVLSANHALRHLDVSLDLGHNVLTLRSVC